LKNSIFWDITPSSPLKANQHFGGTFLLHFQGEERCIVQAESKFVVSKHGLTSNGLYGVISQKMELFITSPARISNP
jgi:hypothetical protein